MARASAAARRIAVGAGIQPELAAGSVSAQYIGHIIAIRHGAAGLGIAVFDLYDFFYLGGVVAAAITAGVIAILSILTFGISGDIGTIFAGAFMFFLSYLIITLPAAPPGRPARVIPR